jgi:Fe(II)/alpha-ketoglutarate-dependent arginine beta-hydroxylase
MEQLSLSAAEVCDIKALLSGVTARYKSVEDRDFLDEVNVIAHDLPRRVRQFLNNFKYHEPLGGACLITGYPVDDERIGRTPSHWSEKQEVSPTLDEEMLFVLFGSLLGDVIGWMTQQDAYLIHDVLPIRDDEDAQISTGSLQPIWWHNEDAFHPFRGDYVSLMCLRNPDGVATTLASMDALKLKPRHVNILFEPYFVLRPDESHAEKNGAACHRRLDEADEALLSAAYGHIEEMCRNPTKRPVLYGSKQSPYICIDPYFMSPPDNDEAQSALNALISAVDSSLSELVLNPGDFLFVDNFRAVHGRRPFKAKYDGRDRWLKRMNVTRDLRKSRSARSTPASRVIF